MRLDSLGRKINPASSAHKIKHGMTYTPTYESWTRMKARCNCVTLAAYVDYGGRGIKICSRWMIFENFLADMGARPEGVGTNLLTADEARQMFEHALAASEKEK